MSDFSELIQPAFVIGTIALVCGFLDRINSLLRGQGE